MNIKEFYKYYAKVNDVTIDEAKIEVRNFANAFKRATISEGRLKLHGFIESFVKIIPEREVVNPQTGEKIISPTKERIKVRATEKFAHMLENFDYEEDI